MKKIFSFNDYCKQRFGCKVYRLPLNTGLSCPNRKTEVRGCIYCDAFGSGAQLYPPNIQSIEDQIKYSINLFSAKRKAEKFYAYFQSYSNTFAEISVLKKLYDSAFIDDRIVGLIIATRPDCIDNKKLELIASYQSKFDVWLEIGLQSANNQTLEWLKRGHTVEDFLRAINLCADLNINTTAHIIFGLPIETKHQMLETAKLVSDSKINGLKIHSLYIIKNTELADIYLKEKFQLLTMSEYCELVIETIKLLDDNIVLHRLTGETDKERLIAPDWVLQKNTVLQTIYSAFGNA